MGGQSSKEEENWGSSSPAFETNPYQSSYDQGSYNHPSSQQHSTARRSDYSLIVDNYRSLDQVTDALARAGLESSNLIVGIDFTKSNEWTGAKSFNRKSLHHLGESLNPYEQAISIIGRTLAAFDEDNLIPCFGFGDGSTHDQDVFSFYPDERYCCGFEDVLRRYREIVPNVRLAGPTSFAPVIEMAMNIVERSGGQYHVLVIIADGQVTRSVDTPPSQLSPQERKTVQAIVDASKLPLSIILVGVGDGPWDTMKEFDDHIPARQFDNFQFVNFTEIMSKNVDTWRKETEFALSALMEIPVQYKATIELNILGRRNGKIPQRVPLPPPAYNVPSFNGPKPPYPTTIEPSVPSFQEYRQPPVPSYQDYGQPVKTAPPAYSVPHFNGPKASNPTKFEPSVPSYQEYSQPSVPSYQEYGQPIATAPPAAVSTSEDHLCPICLSNPKDMAFGCGHQTCCSCGETLQQCPICRSSINTRIKLY